MSVGEIPHVCKEIIARDARWRDMVANVKTVATQAFQVWLREDMEQLGWVGGPVTLAGFEHPFDTWSDMGHVVLAESWRHPPRSVGYFCSVLADLELRNVDAGYPVARRDEVRRNAIYFLNSHIRHLWPRAVRPSGEFRWELLCDPLSERPAAEPGDELLFDSSSGPPTSTQPIALFWLFQAA